MRLPWIGTEIFEFLADNTVVEWGEVKTKKGDYISTIGVEDRCRNYGVIKGLNLGRKGIKEVNHSHPRGTYPSDADYRNASDIEKLTGYSVEFNVYVPLPVRNQKDKNGHWINYYPYTTKLNTKWLELFNDF